MEKTPQSVPQLCPRCSTRPAGLSRPPFRGALGEEIQRRVCPPCWDEWKRAEVMVINELKLNFMEPTSQEILTAHMREFLGFDQPAAPGVR
ncbi:MAG: Fe(2+)-trafficking protein [Thermoanaerobaculia bacterium]|jgi:Fe-S cluster biosynthesis and repair protein YggX|nr:Fe(2+)-trafficking protein [Thermoanaerobaculia bacterium]MBP9826112.1 Fe(2+)-trafficking protein [Thermoanaerobaculia bacterium]